MTRTQGKCPRCGEPASGRFCSSCGASLGNQDCTTCGKPLTPGSLFCHHCGAPASPGAARSAGSRGIPQAWMIAGAVLLVLAAFVIGQKFVAGTSAESAGAAAGAPFGGGSSPSSAEIANMSPEEAANRLFDRVMRYSSEGKADSAAIFAPMAIMAYERLGPPDLHARYDIGMIANASGDSVSARAQADTILKSQPAHLLGLLLAARAADMRKDAAAAARFRTRFAAAAPAERAKQLREYVDHQSDIDGQLSRSSKAP